jgi:formylglycine-generating enzyme
MPPHAMHGMHDKIAQGSMWNEHQKAWIAEVQLYDKQATYLRRLWTLLLFLALSVGGLAFRAEAKSIITQARSGNQSAHLKKHGMVWIPPGTFWMGSDDTTFDDTRPVHLVRIKGFWIDLTEVTNEEFAQFVKSTGYKTLAEKKPESRSVPPISTSRLVPSGLVFTPPPHPVARHDHRDWWRSVPGADWQHPEGPDSNLNGLWKHPVVHVAWQDADAYAKWAGKRLPTEAEFEYAARGGLDRCKFSWGNELKPGGKWQANIWQGDFPNRNTVEDGFAGTAPVASFPSNHYGLYDMTGNVWEWCSDWYRPNFLQRLPATEAVENPSGPIDSFDPFEPNIPKRVLKGGSYLCTDQYCTRYFVGARGKCDYTSSCCNVGFRCAK